MKDSEEWKKYQESVDNGSPEYDLIFPFCKWTTTKGFITFETKFMTGKGLMNLISTLDDVGGEDQRVVFWFDN